MNRDERRAMSRLIDMFGAEVMVNLRPPATRSPRARAMVRDTCTDGCDGCPLCDAAPIWPSLTGQIDLTVLGVKPSPLLKSAVGKHADLRRVAWIPAEVCDYDTDQCLYAAGAPCVLLVGGTALAKWRKDLLFAQARNVVGVWRNTYMVTAVPMPPSGRVERRDWERDTEDAVRLLLSEMVGGVEGCLERGCEGGLFAFDQDGLPWCQQHLNPKEPKVVKGWVDVPLPFDQEEAS
jgi:hypothetical protein